MISCFCMFSFSIKCSTSSFRSPSPISFHFQPGCCCKTSFAVCNSRSAPFTAVSLPTVRIVLLASSDLAAAFMKLGMTVVFGLIVSKSLFSSLLIYQVVKLFVFLIIWI